MKTKSFGFSMLAAVSALTLSAVAFGTNASATDTASPTPAPVISTDSGASDEVEILSLLSNQPEVTQNTPVVDASSDANKSEDAIEQAAFDDDVKAAVLAGDSATSAQLTASSAIVTSIDSPEIAAIAADDAEANTLILGLPQK